MLRQPITTSRLNGGLLSVAADMSSLEGWREGWQFRSHCGATGYTHSCASVEPKEILEPGDDVNFDPFNAYHGEECTDLFTQDLSANTKQKELVGLQPALAKELHGAYQSGNPSLQSAAVDMTPAEPQGLVNTLQALVDNVCQSGVGDIVIHAPLFTLPEWLEHNLIVWNGRQYLMGAIPVSFDCYPNVGPTDPANGADPNEQPVDGSGLVWLYASGPVEYATGVPEEVTNFDRGTNLTVSVWERLAIVAFDPCSVIAAKARAC